MFAALLLICQPEPASSQAVDVPALYGTPAELQATFAKLRAGDDAFGELVQRKYAAGWNNVVALARALELEGERAFDSGDYDKAARYASHARELAPASVSARMLLVKAGMLLAPANVGANFDALIGLLRVALSDYRFLRLAIANAATIAWVGLAALCSVILLVLFLRRVRYVAHDFTTMMPRNTPRAYAYGILLLLLLLPLALRAGALSVFLVLVLLPFAHEETGERVVATLAFLVLASLPLALPELTRAWVATEGKGTDLYRVTRTMSAEGAKLRLETELKRSDTVDARAALGLYAKRNGDLVAAREHLQQALTVAPQRADVLVNLGAVHYLLGDTELAEKTFDRAVNNNPNSVAALFNASQMLYKAGEAQRGTDMLGRGQKVNQELTNVFGVMARAIGPRFMAEEVLPSASLWRASPYAHEATLAEGAAQAMYPLLIGRVAAMTWLFVGLGVIVFAWVFAMLMQRHEMALPCPRCGRAISRRTDKELPDRSLCGQCYHAFVLADVDTAARIAKEVECLRYERRRAGLVTAATVMLAGTGHLLRGRPLAGAFYLAFAGFAWTLFVFATSTLPVPVRVGLRDASLIGIVLAGFIWLLSGIAALMTVPKKD